DCDLDEKHADVAERRPQPAGKEAYERAEQTDEQAHAGDDEEPSVRHALQGTDLGAQGQELLRDAETEPQLVLPVHDRARKPADEGAEHGSGKQSKHEPGDGAREHRAPDRQPDEVVVHHASRLGLTLDRRKIKSASAIAGTASPYPMYGRRRACRSVGTIATATPLERTVGGAGDGAVAAKARLAATPAFRIAPSGR